jgi:hypothetical protein
MLRQNLMDSTRTERSQGAVYSKVVAVDRARLAVLARMPSFTPGDVSGAQSRNLLGIDPSSLP